MDKVVIYGLGNDYMNEDWGGYDIIAVSDSNIGLRGQYKNNFILPEDISNYDFDYVIITLEQIILFG